LEDAISNVESHVPSAENTTGGTLLGSTLTMYPSGQKILADARVGLSHTKVSLEELKPFAELLQTFALAIDSVAHGGLLTAHENVFSPLSLVAKRLAEHVSSKMTHVLPGYLPSWSSEDVKPIMDQWTLLNWKALHTVLTPCCRADVSLESLAEWVNNTGSSRSRSNACFAMVLQLKQLTSPSGSLVKNVIHGFNLLSWLVDASKFLTHSSSDEYKLGDLKSLQKKYQLYLKPFADAGEPRLDVAPLLKSPLLSKSGSYALQMKHVLHAQANSLMKPLRDAIVGFFGVETLRLLDLSDASDERLDGLKGCQIPTESYHDANKWAADTADNTLQLQLEACERCLELYKALALAETCRRKYFTGLSSMRDRKVNRTQTDTVHELRSRYQAFLKSFETCASVFDKEFVEKDGMHVQLFDTVIDLKSVEASAKVEVLAFEAVVSTIWSQDLDTITKAINTYCPGWQAAKETLLAEREMVTALINVSNDHSVAIGQLVGELSSQIQLIKSVKQGTPLVTADKIKAAQSTVTFGKETVAYKVFVTCTEKDWHKCTSPAECHKEVQTLRLKMKEKDVAMTDQMLECLARWESGEKLTELEKAREIAEVEAKRLAVDVAASAAADREPEAKRLAVDAAATAAADREPDASARTGSGATDASTKRAGTSLAQRAMAAKKKRVDGGV